MRRMLLSCLYLCFLATSAMAQTPVSKNFLTGVAIGGHNTVAYFDDKNRQTLQEVEGTKKFRVQWNDAFWYFSTASDRDKFIANPEAYIPEFNGHCANALSLGEGLVKTNGKTWRFFGDKLYLFYAQKGLNRWETGDYEEYLAEAENAWRQLTNIVTGDKKTDS